MKKNGQKIRSTPEGDYFWTWNRSGTELVQTFVPVAKTPTRKKALRFVEKLTPGELGVLAAFFDSLPVSDDLAVDTLMFDLVFSDTFGIERHRAHDIAYGLIHDLKRAF